MVDPEVANEAFTKFYVKLTEALPVNDLVVGLFANKLLPGDHKDQIHNLRTRKEKARYLLDEVIKPGLLVGYTEQFSKMIDIMESSDDPVAKFLVKQIQEYLLGASSSNSDDNDNDLSSCQSPPTKKKKYIQICGTTMPSSKVEFINYQELGSVALSFTRLSAEIFKLLLEENFVILKLTCEKVITDVQLPEYLSNKIRLSDNTNDLISVLSLSPYWNWTDIRLMEKMAAISGEATDMLRQYKEYLKSENLIDHLPYELTIPEDIDSNYKIMKTRVRKSINFTIVCFFKYRDILETEILGLKVGACILTHIRIGKKAFEIDWLIPSKVCSDAFKSAKRNHKNFNQVSLYSVHIESYEVIPTEAIPQISSNSDDLYKCPVTNDSIPSKTDISFHDYLHLLGLTERYPRGLTLKDSLVVRRENIANTDKPEELPYLMLQKIMMFDVNNGTGLYTGNICGSPALESINEIHPLDTLVTLLHCCDNFLTQVILTRLSTCQLAIPFLLPHPCDGKVRLLLWGMREIIKAWKSTDINGKLVPNECRIVDYPAPIISFYKIGQLQRSKSRLINEIISKPSTDYFFNWHCIGGYLPRSFVDGMAELCCYLPSGRNDFYSNIIFFANLRGDARKHSKQLKFMQKISYLSCVLLQENNLDNKVFTLLKELAKCPGGVVIMVDSENENLKQQMYGIPTIVLKGKNNLRIRHEVCKEIVGKLNSSVGTHKKLSECVKIARSSDIEIDEDDEGCRHSQKLAEEIVQQVILLPAHVAKLEILPLQGPDMWHKWATLQKECHRHVASKSIVSIEAYRRELEAKKEAIRQNQFNFTVKPTPVMKMFLSNLLNHSGNVRLYFLQWLKMMLDDYSRRVPISAELLIAEAESDSKTVTHLKDKLKLQNEQLVNASFGLEHFFREMGQMFEASRDIQVRDLPDIPSFPQIVADLMSEGYPIELMDGDAAHVPITWISAVIDQLNQHMQKKKIFIVSILGMQSSGKSTLLNTMFGLCFNVSAGRCTRGAFVQLLSLDTALSKETGCDHILIVDTEGLGAFRLKYEESPKHDNELATFVLGLADLTIINLFGESPGNLTNLLQTAVHAFIRMKNVDMGKKSCHFVYQNVTAVHAANKTKIGRGIFLDMLDHATSNAAKIEQCEERFRYFKDVIKFNDETGVTFFPSLWRGDPPMAPINSGYTSTACRLKEAIINVIANEKKSNFKALQLQMEVLWSAVLQEHFVFSFKNTLDVNAYIELDQQCYQWSQEYQRKYFEWQYQADVHISSCNVSDIDSVVANCQSGFEQDFGLINLKQVKELVEFFENRQSNTLEQWRKITEIKVATMYNEYKDEARKYCNVLHQSRKSKIKIDELKLTYLQQLRAMVVTLALDDKISAFSVQERKEIFDKQWCQWIAKLSKSKKPEYTTAEHMQTEIINILIENFNAHSHLVVQALSKKPLSERGILELEISHLHLKSTKWFFQVIDNKDYHSAKVQTKDYFHHVEKWMEGVIERCQDFNKSSISNMLTKLRKSIDKFNSGKQRFTFTVNYEVDIAVTVAGYAYKQFIAKLKQLALENDPIEAMNRLKPTSFRTFEAQISEVSIDQAAACNLCDILTNHIEKALLAKLALEVVEAVRCISKHFQTKKDFKILVMKDLVDAQDFELFKVYLTNTETSLKYWSRMYVRRHCEMKNDNGNTILFNLAQKNLKVIVDAIINAISTLNENCGPSKDSHKIFDVKVWLQHFQTQVKKFIAIDLQETIDIVDHIYNQDIFTKELIKHLEKQSESILGNFKDTSVGVTKLIELGKYSPDLVLYDSLIGCKELCPFCKEQCELMEKNHSQPHHTALHRPMCLGGFVKEAKLVLETCTQAIQTDTTFKNADTNYISHPYKKYKDIYPNWVIVYVETGHLKYWKWFITKYNSEIAEMNQTDPTPINDRGWHNITEEDAIKSLDMEYS